LSGQKTDLAEAAGQGSAEEVDDRRLRGEVFHSLFVAHHTFILSENRRKFNRMKKKSLFEAVRRTAGTLVMVLAFGLTMTGCATTNKGGAPGLLITTEKPYPFARHFSMLS
jgi:hypothetical protein